MVFSKFDVVEPDLLFMSNERAAAVLTEANVQGAPELVIEIGWPGTRQRDETIQRRLYERSGVSEYWVVDPEIDVVRVFRRGAEGFKRPVELRGRSRQRAYHTTVARTGPASPAYVSFVGVSFVSVRRRVSVR